MAKAPSSAEAYSQSVVMLYASYSYYGRIHLKAKGKEQRVYSKKDFVSDKGNDNLDSKICYDHFHDQVGLSCSSGKKLTD
ncbi:hypothetical protein L484_025207 [Morus notabilis]|uniref:Uncharacterized protein n=1 Tax=Morus notabilis TaxID=981085 RepID=W9SIM1_9ROSA|nr:hypothetical protein L484_025207 [Morus notabilis]